MHDRYTGASAHGPDRPKAAWTRCSMTCRSDDRGHRVGPGRRTPRLLQLLRSSGAGDRTGAARPCHLCSDDVAGCGPSSKQQAMPVAGPLPPTPAAAGQRALLEALAIAAAADALRGAHPRGRVDRRAADAALLRQVRPLLRRTAPRPATSPRSCCCSRQAWSRISANRSRPGNHRLHRARRQSGFRGASRASRAPGGGNLLSQSPAG